MIESTSVVENANISATAYVGHNCVIGAPPEKIGVYPKSPFPVEIGERTQITGACTIDSGVKRSTVIGDDCFIMKQVHIGHCCLIANNVTIAPHATIGGGVTIGEGCNIGIGVAIHPNVSIPPYCMLGMNCVITKHQEIKPFSIMAGNPARWIGFNQRAIEKFGLTPDQVTEIQNDWINERQETGKTH